MDVTCQAAICKTDGGIDYKDLKEQKSISKALALVGADDKKEGSHE